MIIQIEISSIRTYKEGEMPASTSVRVQDAFMRSKAKPRSIDMVSSEPTALAWLIAGFLNAENDYVSCTYNEDGFLVIRGLRPGWMHFDRPHHNVSITRMANHICEHFEQMPADFKREMADTVVHDDNFELKGWHAKSEQLDDGTMTLRIKPA